MHYKVLSNDDAVEFSKLLSNGRWVVLFYADWCGHCNAMKPEWNKAVKKLANSKHINIADINSNVIKQVILIIVILQTNIIGNINDNTH